MVDPAVAAAWACGPVSFIRWLEEGGMGVKAPLEKDIQRTIRDYLSLLGALPIRMNSGAFGGEHKGKRWYVRLNDLDGCPDLIVCLSGRFVAVEVKRPGEKPTDKQTAALDAIRRAGGLAFVARSVDDVEKALRAEGLA